MKIGICDDELVQTKLLSFLVRKWAGRNNRLVTIEIFDSAEAFQFAWSEDKSYDVLLLDIQMSGQNGIELAKIIRQSDDTLAIIFITGFSDYIDEGYEVSALHYLIKPIKEDKLFACLDKARKRIQLDRKTILLCCNGENLRIYQDEIVYIEAFAHTVIITTINKRYEIKKSIGVLEKELDAAMFYRGHRSYIVSLKYVLKIGKTGITLENGVQVPVSRRSYKGVNKAFIDFYRSEK